MDQRDSLEFSGGCAGDVERGDMEERFSQHGNLPGHIRVAKESADFCVLQEVIVKTLEESIGCLVQANSVSEQAAVTLVKERIFTHAQVRPEPIFPTVREIVCGATEGFERTAYRGV